jgi:hypothetical protein
MKTFREAFDRMHDVLKRVADQFVNVDGMTGGNAVDLAKNVLAEVTAADLDNPKLPTRPLDVLPCPECGGKKGHVPGCGAGFEQSLDYENKRVDALSGRTLKSISIRSRDSMRMVFEGNVVLLIDHRQINFSSRGLVLTVKRGE